MRPRALTMLGTIAKKLAQCIVVLFLLSLAVFYMARLAPGDPLRSYYGESVERMSPQERETAIHSLGLDQPIYKQYGIWLQNAFDGDWGISFKYKQPVTSVLGSMYQNTLLLGGLAYVCTFGLALLLGVCLRTLTAALQSRDALGRNICVGIFAALFLQTVINLGMNLQVLPVIGVTLPFFSAGGSSVVMMYLCVGLVLSVGLQARRSRVDAVAIL